MNTTKGHNMKYERKTKDMYFLLVNYGYGHGYEEVVIEETREDINERAKEYRENQPQYPLRIVRKRIRKGLV